MEEFSVGLAMMVIIILAVIGIISITGLETNYQLPKDEWKCEKVINVNDDITNVECVLYSKKEK